MGECIKRTVVPSSRVAVDTFAGRIQVEWDPDAAVTPFGQLPFFIEFLKEDQVAFEAGMKLNMGQLLSIPFVIAGFIWLYISLKQKKRIVIKRK
jgi:hypothetical protein